MYNLVSTLIDNYCLLRRNNAASYVQIKPQLMKPNQTKSEIILSELSPMLIAFVIMYLFMQCV